MKEFFYCECKISRNNAWFIVLNELLTPELIYTTQMAQDYALRNKNKIIINAGLFNTRTSEPNGQLIIQNKIIGIDAVVESDMGAPIGANECYPLIIDDGKMFVASTNRLSDKNEPDILEKYKFAVCGWGNVIEDGKDAHIYDYEIRWGKDSKARQVVGYLRDGRTFILTCQKAYYKDIVAFLLKNEAMFAYSLDGGKSTKLFINGEQINGFCFGYKGRKYIPTLLQWGLNI